MKRIRTDSEKLQRFRLVLRFSQEQLEKDTVCGLKCTVRQAVARLQGQRRPTLWLELLIFQLGYS